MGRRCVAASSSRPSCARGIWRHAAAAPCCRPLGRVVVPFVVQQTTDRRHPRAPAAPTPASCCATSRSRRGRRRRDRGLRRTSSTCASSGRPRPAWRRCGIKAFRHIHDLSVLTQNTERRGSLVSRVTSATSTRSRCSCSSAASCCMVTSRSSRVATVLMVVYSPPLGRGRLALLRAAVPHHPHVPGHRRPRPTRAVRERVGDMLGADLRVRRRRGDDPRLRRRGPHGRSASTPPSRRTAQAAIGAQARSVVAFTSGQLVSGLTTAVVLVVGTLLGGARAASPSASCSPSSSSSACSPSPVQTGHRDPQRDAERRRRLAPGASASSTPRPTSPTRARPASTLPRGPITVRVRRRRRSPTPAARPCSTTSTCGSRRAVAGRRSSARPARARRRSPSCSPG